MIKFETQLNSLNGQIIVTLQQLGRITNLMFGLEGNECHSVIRGVDDLRTYFGQLGCRVLTFGKLT